MKKNYTNKTHAVKLQNLPVNVLESRRVSHEHLQFAHFCNVCIVMILVITLLPDCAGTEPIGDIVGLINVLSKHSSC